MKNWKIAVWWMESGVVNIEAKTLEEAIKLAADENDPLPLWESEYIDESFRVDIETSKELNEEITCECPLPFNKDYCCRGKCCEE